MQEGFFTLRNYKLIIIGNNKSVVWRKLDACRHEYDWHIPKISIKLTKVKMKLWHLSLHI